MPRACRVTQVVTRDHRLSRTEPQGGLRGLKRLPSGWYASGSAILLASGAYDDSTAPLYACALSWGNSKGQTVGSWTSRAPQMPMWVVEQKWRWPRLHRPSQGLAMDQDTNDDGRHQRRLRVAERRADQAFEARLGAMCKAGQSRRDRCLAVALRGDVGRRKGGGDRGPPEAMPLLRLSGLSSRADAWVSPQHRPARRTA